MCALPNIEIVIFISNLKIDKICFPEYNKTQITQKQT